MDIKNSNNSLEYKYASRNGFARAIEIIWLSGLFLIPVFFNPASHQAFYLNKILLLQFMVIAMVALSLGDCLYRRALPGIAPWQQRITVPLYIAVCLFGLVAIVSTILSITPSVSFWGSWARKAGLLTILCYIAFFLIMAGYMHTRKQLYRAVLALLLSSGLVALLGILQHYFPEANAVLGYRRFSERVFSTTGNALALSGFLAMVMPITLAVAFTIWNKQYHPKHILKRTGIVVLFALQLWCLYLAQYSITILLFIIAPVIFITLLGIINKRLLLLGTGLVSLLLIAIVAVMLIMPLLFSSTAITVSKENEISQPTGNAENLGLYTLGNRVQHWKNTARMIVESRENPPYYDKFPSLRLFIGYGPETFIMTYQRYYPDKFKADVTYYSMLMDRPHNHYLYIAASLGVLGLLCFLAIIIAFFYLCFRLIKKTDIYGDKVFLIGMMASIVGYLVDSLFNPSTVLTNLVFWMVLALVISIGKSIFNSQGGKWQVIAGDHDIQRKTWFSRYFTRIHIYCAACLTTGIIIFGGMITAKPFLADIHLQRGLDLRVVDIEQALDEYERAIELEPQVAAYWGFLGDYGYLMARSFNETSMKKEFLTLSTDSYEKARELEPYIAYRYYTLADVYIYDAINGNVNKWPVVFSLYDKALQLFPDNVVILNKWSSALFIKGDIEEAWEKRDLSAKIDPNWSETEFLSALYLTVQDENERAVEIIIDEIGKVTADRNYYNHFSRFCFRLASYNVLDQLHEAIAMYAIEMPEEWRIHAVYGITSFYMGGRETSVNEFDKAMSMIPNNEAGNLFKSIYELTRMDPSFTTMVADVAFDWRDKLEKIPDSDSILKMYDYLVSAGNSSK